MAEYIKREAAMDIVRRTRGDYATAFSELRRLPAADVEPVRHGEWVLERLPDGKPYCFHCSICDNDFHHIGIKTAYRFCPNCGAKMDGKAPLKIRFEKGGE